MLQTCTLLKFVACKNTVLSDEIPRTSCFCDNVPKAKQTEVRVPLGGQVYLETTSNVMVHGLENCNCNSQTLGDLGIINRKWSVALDLEPNSIKLSS